MDLSAAQDLFFSNLLIPAGKLILGLSVLMIFLGMLIGAFTYNKPLKPSKDDSIITASLELGEGLGHLLISKLLGKKQRSVTTLTSDRQLLNQYKGMSPSEFEHAVAEIFRKLGFTAEVVGGKSDGGIDINLSKDGNDSVVQCKKFLTRKVTPSDIRDFYGAMTGKLIDEKSYFVTTNFFTLEAENFASDKPIELIDGKGLVALIRQTEGQAQLEGEEEGVDIENDSCSKCGGNLVVRTNKKNGEKFIGCSNFPKCKYTQSI